MKKLNSKSPAIGLFYYRNLCDTEELEAQRKALEEIGISLIERDETGVFKASMDEFTNMVSVVLSNSLVQGYLLGLMTNANYDIIRKTIIWMWNSIIGKTLTKISGNGQIEEKEITFGLKLKIHEFTEIDISLSGDVSDELKSKCIDETFKFIKNLTKEEKPTDKEFAKYDWDKHQWYLVDTNEVIQKIIERQQHTGSTKS